MGMKPRIEETHLTASNLVNQPRKVSEAETLHAPNLCTSRKKPGTSTGPNLATTSKE